jgi:phage gp29-like protein
MPSTLVKFIPGLELVRQKIAAYIAARIPTSRHTILRPLLTEQALLSAQIDVGTVHAILDGTDTGQTNEYFALCDLIILSDPHMQGEISKRKLALLGDQLNVNAADKKKLEDRNAADAIREMIDGLPTFLNACGWLLDGTIWPLAMVEKVFRPATKNRKLNFEVRQLIQVPPRLFDYSETGFLRLWDTDPETGNILATRSEVDPMRYIIHRGHLLPTPDYRGGPMRALVFWWLFSLDNREWWARFLDRYGSPFMVGKYDQADDDSRIILEQAFMAASKLSGIVISRQTEVELKEATSKSTGEGFDLFLKTANREKSKLIVGQTTSADAEHGGLSGSGVSQAQAQVRDDIRQFDSIWLANTLKYQLFDPFLRMNGFTGSARISWGSEQAADIEQKSSGIANLSNAGIEVTDDGLETLSGWFGVPLQRKKVDPATAPPPPRGKTIPFSVTPSTRYDAADAANSRIAREGAPRLARAFRGVYAPVAKLVADSTGPEDLVAKITAFYADWSPEQLAPLILESLSAQAANGAIRDVA